MNTKTLAAHPSRSARKCGDCRFLYHAWHSEKPSNRGPWCLHPSTPVSLITASPLARCDAMRASSQPLRLAELGSAHCGPDGELFEVFDDPSHVPCNPMEPVAPSSCATCKGLGLVRAPYAREATDCPDCLTSRISAATDTTVASVNPAGNSA